MKRFLGLFALLCLIGANAHAQVSVTSQMFDAGMNKSTTVQCFSDGNNIAASLYGIRLWDDGIKLAQVFPSSLTPTFTAFDTWINTRIQGVNARSGINLAIGANCPTTTGKILYTFGATPEWASACHGQGDPSPCLPGPTGTTPIGTNCSITASAAVLTCPGGGFSSFTTTEGPAISVTGAGAAGATLTTYISTYTSATQVTLAANASTTVTSTGTATLLGFGGGTQCSGPAPNPDFGCTPYADNQSGGLAETDATQNAMAAAIVARYAGKINYYELGNENDSTNFECIFGSPTLCGGGNPLTTANTASLKREVRRNWDMRNIILCGDSNAKFLSPSFHVNTALTWFHYYNITSISAPAGVAGVNGVPAGCNWSAATVTGAQTYDYVNVHPRGLASAYPTSTGNWNPANMVTAVTNTQTEIANDNLPNPGTIFCDEYGYNSSLEGGSNTTGYSAYVAQTLIFGISTGCTQMYWYQWDTTTIGLQGALQGTAWDTTAAGWLIGGTLSTCTLTSTTYSCPLTNGGITELLVWDTSKYSTTCCLAPANQTFSTLYTYYKDLTGVQRPMVAGVAPVGWSPILLQQIGSVVLPPTQITGSTNITGSVVIQ